MERLTPRKLAPGDAIRVIAPARPLAMLDSSTMAIADGRLQDLGLHVTFGRHVEAFADVHVRAILTVIGGDNSNQLLRYIDWDLIRAHPKIFCGYSDIANDGYLVLNEGIADGTILGGNLCTLNLLQGTEYAPEFADAIIFLEDDAESRPGTFDQYGFERVRGLVIGRFQKASGMTPHLLRMIVQSKSELRAIPVIAGVEH